MTTISYMKEYLSNKYSDNFAKRLKNMPDNQVCAIYFRVIEKERQDLKEQQFLNNQPRYIQETLF